RRRGCSGSSPRASTAAHPTAADALERREPARRPGGSPARAGHPVRRADEREEASMGQPRDGIRIERDSMGEMEVPADALWGASTQRAVLNFPVSGERMPRRFLEALGLVKAAAASANAALGVL